MSTVQPQPHIGLSTPPPMVWQQPRFVARPTGVRIAMFVAMVVGLVGTAGFLMYLFTSGISEADYATQAEYDSAVAVGTGLAYLAFGTLLMLVMALLAPKVSYRRRDAFFVLVPIWSWVFQVRVLWRVTALPDRDWAPRPEEYDGAAHYPQQRPYFDLFNR